MEAWIDYHQWVCKDGMPRFEWLVGRSRQNGALVYFDTTLQGSAALMLPGREETSLGSRFVEAFFFCGCEDPISCWDRQRD